MILIDLDGFKRINDEQGHLEGDRILKAFAAALNQSIRKDMDSAYRYGGDEFVVLLPGSGVQRAQRVISKIETSARRLNIPQELGFSYGVAPLPASGSLADLIRLADERMFVMKARNKRRKITV